LGAGTIVSIVATVIGTFVRYVGICSASRCETLDFAGGRSREATKGAFLQLPGDAAGEEVGADPRRWCLVDPLPLVTELGWSHVRERGQRVVEAGDGQPADSMQMVAAAFCVLVNARMVLSSAARQHRCHLPPG
jgi:hypothetical protein